MRLTDGTWVLALTDFAKLLKSNVGCTYCFYRMGVLALLTGFFLAERRIAGQLRSKRGFDVVLHIPVDERAMSVARGGYLTFGIHRIPTRFVDFHNGFSQTFHFPAGAVSIRNRYLLGELHGDRLLRNAVLRYAKLPVQVVQSFVFIVFDDGSGNFHHNSVFQKGFHLLSFFIVLEERYVKALTISGAKKISGG